MRNRNKNLNFKPSLAMVKFNKRFENTGNTFSAAYAAYSWLKDRGFSYGSTCFSPYVAIQKGEYGLPQKLHNFSREDIKLIDGVIYSTDYRDGAVTIMLYHEIEEEEAK